MWSVIIFVFGIAFLSGIVFIAARFAKFNTVKKITRRKKGLSFFLGLIITLALIIIFYLLFDLVNTVIIIIHLMVFFSVCDFIPWLIGKLKKRSLAEGKFYIQGVTAIVLCTVYLSLGWYFAHHVYRTYYHIQTEKNIGENGFRIVGFSDSHIGSTFHADKLSEYVKRMNEEKPDIAVIVGDFVDDSTKKTDMENACLALKELNTKYGVYYVFGNHDAGYYGNSRGYDSNDLISNLEKNNVTVLFDNFKTVTDKVCLIGRIDRSRYNRAEISDLTDIYKNSYQKIEIPYIITLDHQPTDYKNESDANCDLVISGHTHGGQMLGMDIGVSNIGGNNRIYGHEKQKNTDFIVSSGISDWAIKFKTGCISEYFVIDITKK